MSIRKFPIYTPLEYAVDDLFSLRITFGLKRTRILMVVFGKTINTSEIPQTYAVLSRNLPQIFMSKCFNDGKLPFADEVRCTEVGHLFEHILLEYLCDFKMEKGYDDVAYSGRTRWNWKKDPRGVFYINISSGYEDTDIFPLALEKTITLVREVMTQSSVDTMLPVTPSASLALIASSAVKAN